VEVFSVGAQCGFFSPGTRPSLDKHFFGCSGPVPPQLRSFASETPRGCLADLSFWPFASPPVQYLLTTLAARLPGPPPSIVSRWCEPYSSLFPSLCGFDSGLWFFLPPGHVFLVLWGGGPSEDQIIVPACAGCPLERFSFVFFLFVFFGQGQPTALGLPPKTLVFPCTPCKKN